MPVNQQSITSSGKPGKPLSADLKLFSIPFINVYLNIDKYKIQAKTTNTIKYMNTKIYFENIQSWGYRS